MVFKLLCFAKLGNFPIPSKFSGVFLCWFAKYFYGNKGGHLTDINGNRVYAGLDVDSNAGCRIDGIKCENITLPEEMLKRPSPRPLPREGSRMFYRL